MIDKLKFWNYFKSQNVTTNACSNYDNETSFKGVFDRAVKYGIPEPTKPENPQTPDVPSYYFPNFKPAKKDDNSPIMVKYAVPPIKDEKDDFEPPVLKYAVPSDRW